MAPSPQRPDWQAVRAHLEQRRRAVLDAIRDYPAPITACDAQFNHLLEQRDAIAQALRDLDAMRERTPADAEPQVLGAFLDDCPCIDVADAAHLRAGPDA